ncbi:MAG: hypothetical protein E2O39_03625 [Planctomycetota bacterium]|nr:MAG: hypothetical protein E2O39_03625 [Planctomycetota bacterium]
MDGRTSIVFRVFGGLLALGATLGSVTGATAPALTAPQGTPYFARAKAGAVIRNFQDRQADGMRTMKGDELLRVHGTGAGVGFLQVEAAGGLEVWVYGQYLKPTTEQGVYSVTAKGVLMRPKASSGSGSMPLTTKLQRGDRVRLIARSDTSKPMKEDWVHVWSPQTARGWVLASEVVRAANQSEAGTAWKTTAVVRPSVPLPVKSVDASAPTGAKGPAVAKKAPSRAQAALRAADELSAKAKANPSAADHVAVIAAYQAVIELAPEDSAVADFARRGVSEAMVRAEMAGIQADIAQAEVERLNKIEAIRAQDEANDLARMPLWGRFNGRGWLETEVVGNEDHFYLRWGGDRTAEITCSSGRYDLASFQGFEIGVNGATARSATGTSVGRPALPMLLDLYRIEVISGTGAKPR